MENRNFNISEALRGCKVVAADGMPAEVTGYFGGAKWCVLARSGADRWVADIRGYSIDGKPGRALMMKGGEA